MLVPCIMGTSRPRLQTRLIARLATFQERREARGALTTNPPNAAAIIPWNHFFSSWWIHTAKPFHVWFEMLVLSLKTKNKKKCAQIKNNYCIATRTLSFLGQCNFHIWAPILPKSLHQRLLIHIWKEVLFGKHPIANLDFCQLRHYFYFTKGLCPFLSTWMQDYFS